MADDFDDIFDGSDDGPVAGAAPVPTAAAAGNALSDLWSPDEQHLPAVQDDLGQALLSAGALTAAQLTSARTVLEQSPGKRLADIFFEMGVDEPVLQQAVARIAHMPFRRVAVDDVEAVRQIERLGYDFCMDHGVMPIAVEDRRLVVGVTQPDNLIICDEVRHKLGADVRYVVVCRRDIGAVILHFKEDNQDTSLAVDEIIKGIDEDDIEVVEQDEEDLDLEKMAGESPVIRFVNYLIFNAVKEGASDIHVEPQEKKLQVRYRIDGVMFEAMNPPAHMHAAIVSRLKIMANLDISERRIPQDGRIRAMVHGRKLDLRVSTLPTAQGEKVVLRILDTRSIQVELEDLGMNEDTLLMWKKQIAQPHGIVLVTGPTGSGKTTTLYSSLGKMDRAKFNISTVEDPVEYHLNGINQTQAHDSIGMTFAAALRALLRQDPDIIMVGEIRDKETARIAIQASLTGHLVLSTLHTNDAPSSVTRLINIGVEPYLIGSALNACVAQRLVRKVCSECRTEVKPDDHIAEHLMLNGVQLDKLWVGQGCDKCRNTGYSGRVGLYELLVLNDAMRDRIAGNPNVSEFRRMCVEGGMVTLRQDGFTKVQQGLTTVEEVLRVTEAVG